MNVKPPKPPKVAVRDGEAATYLVKPEEAAVLDKAFKIMQRELKRGTALSDPQAAGSFFKSRLLDRDREVFACIFTDNRHRLIAYEELFLGTIDGAEVHPREVVKRGLALNAAAVILAHNHPSGNREPSAADRAVTARLKQALAMVDMRLLDHFIIADGPPVSLAARGWI